MSRTGILLFAHGARDPNWAIPFEAVSARLRSRSSAAGAQAPEVSLAFLEFMSPDIATAGDDLPTHIGEQLALGVGQACGFLQDAGAADVVDHQAALLIARLEHQFAVSSGQLPLHPRLPDVRGTFSRAIEQLASGEQRQQGNND